MFVMKYINFGDLILKTAQSLLLFYIFMAQILRLRSE